MDREETKGKVLEVIAPRGSRPVELRTRLRVRGTKLNDHQIVAILRDLQRDGHVTLSRGRWSRTDEAAAATGDLPPQPVDPPVPQTNGRVGFSPTRSPSEAFGTQELDAVETAATPKYTGPWATFRKLLDYYVDCVRSDASCEAAANLSDHGERFASVASAGPWFPRSGQPWSHSFNATAVPSLARALATASDADVVVLGYPLWIYVKGGDQSPFLKPIFTYNLEASLDGETLRVKTDAASPDVNLDWLSYALPDSEEQRAFLTAAGLMDRGLADESVGDGSRGYSDPEFDSLATATAVFFADNLREKLDPSRPIGLFPTDKLVTGIYNRPLIMAAKRPRYTRSLLRELSRIRSAPDADLDKTALRFFFRSDVSADDVIPPHEETVVDVCALNGEQRSAVAALLHGNAITVTGPPGTGKSQVVSATLANARVHGLTALFTSRNHKAIDAVVQRPELNPDETTRLIARANDRQQGIRFGFREAFRSLLEEPPTTAAHNLEKSRTRIGELLEQRGELAREITQILDIRDALEDEYQTMNAASPNWTDQQRRELEAVYERFPHSTVSRLARATDQLSRLSGRSGLISWIRTRWLSYRSERLRHGLRRKLSRSLETWDLRAEPSTLVATMVRASGYCTALKKAGKLTRLLEPHRDQTTLTDALAKHSDELRKLAGAFLVADEAARTGLPENVSRGELAAVRVAFKDSESIASPETRRELARRVSSAASQILRRFPCWTVTNLSIRNRIELLPGLFDLAVIDEASQCDIPSSIPVLYRARRCGVVGDPAQLQHTTKLSATRDLHLRRRHGLNDLDEQRFSYRETSLFQLAVETEGVVRQLLRDHYRCAAEIADYANRQFYGSKLRLVTAADRLNVPRGMKPGIHWTHVVSEIEGRATGCVAALEAEACIAQLEQLLLAEAFDGTVGIVTPFREQKNLISKLLARNASLARAGQRANLIVDTAHGFQGDERDVMLLSLCGGPDMPSRSASWIRNTSNLLNVAVTRARAVLHVVGNRDWAAECGIRHVQELLPQPPASAPGAGAFESPWEKAFHDALEDHGIHTVPQFPLVGRRLDLAVLDTDPPIDLEVDGARYHLDADGTRRRDDLWRDIQIRGAGWHVMRFWVHDLREDMLACVKQVKKAMRKNK